MVHHVADSGGKRHAAAAAAKDFLLSISPRGWELIAGLVAPVILFGALLCGEAILRIQQFRAFGPNQAVETTISREVWEVVDGRRRPLPNAVMGGIHFNANGFRGDALVMPKPEGFIRVGFFGTSTTMDPYVDNESETWAAITVGQLRRAFPACKFDYLNAGVAGYTLGAVKARMMQEGLQFQPDIAILMVNDISNRGRALAGQNDNTYMPSWLARHSLLWLKVEKTANAERLKRVTLRKDIAKRLDMEALASGARRDIRGMLEDIVGTAVLPVLVENSSLLRREQSLSQQAENAEVGVLYLPNVYISDMTESYYGFNDQMRAVAAEYSLPFIETMNALPADRAYYVDTHHTSKAGSRVLGETVGTSLAKHPAIRKLIAERGKGCMVNS